MTDKTGIDALLDLSGQVIDQEGAYWVKLEAWRVWTRRPPFLTVFAHFAQRLRDRVKGFDNAHAVWRPRQDRYSGRIMTYDHQHRHTKDKGVPYEFQDAYQLMKDCFTEVDKIIQEARF